MLVVAISNLERRERERENMRNILAGQSVPSHTVSDCCSLHSQNVPKY